MRKTTQRLTARVCEPVRGYPDLIAQQVEHAGSNKPSAFAVRAQLLSQGRTETVLAASNLLTVRLKVYASGGENMLHAHAEEDHVFVILQGEAEFFDAQGPFGIFGAHQGVLLPRGNVYRFNSTGGEPLVMLRLGAPNESALGLDGRIDRHGTSFDPADDAKNQVPPQPIPGHFFG
jgi:mannose-6-phosphate isomerase-like protein (cupin superfamily)